MNAAMLLQDAPPDTSGYMLAGFAVFFLVAIIYVASLAIRRANLERDLETLESLRGASEVSTQPRARAAASVGRPKAPRARQSRGKPPRKKATRKK